MIIVYLRFSVARAEGHWLLQRNVGVCGWWKYFH